MERFCDPFLPKTKVARAFVSGIMPEDLIDELNALGIRTHVLGRSKNLCGEVAYHPDMLLNNFKKGLWACEHNADYLPKDLPGRIFRETEAVLRDKYPFNCLFNNFNIGNTLVCGVSVHPMIKMCAKYEDKRIILVPQNYTKCCTIPINKKAVITCDKTIASMLKRGDFDVLFIDDKEGVGLNGFDYGFIGGCAAMLSENLLGFTGNLNTYKFGDDIRDFCANHGVDAFSLSSHRMYDFGGILPITEYVPRDEQAFSDTCDLSV